GDGALLHALEAAYQQHTGRGDAAAGESSASGVFESAWAWAVACASSGATAPRRADADGGDAAAATAGALAWLAKAAARLDKRGARARPDVLLAAVRCASLVEPDAGRPVSVRVLEAAFALLAELEVPRATWSAVERLCVRAVACGVRGGFA